MTIVIEDVREYSPWATMSVTKVPNIFGHIVLDRKEMDELYSWLKAFYRRDRP